MRMLLCWHSEYLVCGFRWATHGLDFLTSVCDPKFLAYLSNDEFEVRAGDLNEGHTRCTGERPAKSVQFIEIFSMSDWKFRDGDENQHTKSCVFTAPDAYMFICTYVTLPSEMSHIDTLSQFRCTGDHPAQSVQFIEIFNMNENLQLAVENFDTKIVSSHYQMHTLFMYICTYVILPSKMSHINTVCHFEIFTSQ